MEKSQFFRMDRWPHMFCAGCGNGIVMNCLYEAFSSLDLDLDKTVFVSGIGCSSRIPGYIFSDSIHTTHGRALTFATGIKLGNSDLNVVVITGDGDLGAIGGNHFINSCRRNMDLTVICVNNNIYGMTGGQESTTTPHGFMSASSPFGKLDYPFDLAAIASTAGANFVARWTVRHVKQLSRSVELALKKDGFSFVEVISSCPTHLGKMNKLKDPRTHMRWLKENSIPLNAEDEAEDPLASLHPLDLNIEGKITTGVFRDVNRKSYLKLLEEGR